MLGTQGFTGSEHRAPLEHSLADDMHFLNRFSSQVPQEINGEHWD